MTGTGRTGHCCDPSTLQNNTGMTWQNDGKVIYMIRCSVLWDIGDTLPDFIEKLSFILNLSNTQVSVFGLIVGGYKFAASRQLLWRLQRMAEVSPVTFLVSSTFSVILLVVKDKKHYLNMCILFCRPYKHNNISMMFSVGTSVSCCIPRLCMKI